jgi:hypothetical protein
MRLPKRVVLLACLSPLLAVSQPVSDRTMLSIFGSEIRLPGECTIMGRSVIDEYTRIHCTLGILESFTVVVWKASVCSAQSLRDSPDTTVRYDSERDGRRYVEAVSGSIITRQIYDAEVCLTVTTSNSERRLDEILRPLWF